MHNNFTDRRNNVSEPINKHLLMFILFLLSVCTFASLSIYTYNFILSTTNIAADKSNESGAQYAEENFDASAAEEGLDDALRTITVLAGDTLSKILSHNNVSKNDQHKINEALKKSKIKFSLKPNQKIEIEYNVQDTDADLTNQLLQRVTIFLDAIKTVQIIRHDNDYVAKESAIKLTKLLVSQNAVIKNSLIATLRAMGLKYNSIQALVKSYSYQLDFQRQIRPGDVITIVTEKFVSPQGDYTTYGNIVYASLKVGKKPHTNYDVYLYAPKGSNAQYYREDGAITKSHLLKTPLKVVKISSKYGTKRKLQGFSYVHKGVDFAAPLGTPILSSGDGVVVSVGWKSGYGKTIKIQHSNNISTLYAHLDSFAKNIKVGSKVAQGQFIGKVGMTGRCTGPHLHHEVEVKGVKVDPMKLHYHASTKLTQEHLKSFNKFKTYITSLNNKFAKGQSAVEVD